MRRKQASTLRHGQCCEESKWASESVRECSWWGVLQLSAAWTAGDDAGRRRAGRGCAPAGNTPAPFEPPRRSVLSGEFVVESVAESMCGECWSSLSAATTWLHGGGGCRPGAAATADNMLAPCETKGPLRVWS